VVRAFATRSSGISHLQQRRVEFRIFNFDLKGNTRMATSSLTDVIDQNTPGKSQGFPLGVPQSYSWYNGKDGAVGSKPPSNFTSVTGWGQVYPEVGAPADAGASVQIADFETFVHLTNGSWVQVQNQSTDPISGAHYNADFSGNASVPWKETTGSDGSASVDAPQSGYNDHFWPGARGTYAAGTVDGVFVEAQMKTSDPNANLVANMGADWWASSNAPFVDGFSNNPGAGMSDWVKLSTSYQTLYFSSLSPAALTADPPPGMSGSSSTSTPPVTTPPVTKPPVTTPPIATPPAIKPAVTQATASPGSGVENTGDKIALTLAFNEAVTVTGKPTLTLNDGDIATYVSGSGTNKLVFSTTVAATDTDTAALAIKGVNVPSGASIKDASGASANLAGAATTFTGLKIDPPTTTSPVTPPVTTPPVTTPPVTTPPVTKPPVTTSPVTTPPVTTSPVTTSPVTTPPVTKPPVTTSPVTTSPVTTPPVTKPPVTTSPVTTPPVTTPPVTTSPVTTSPVTTSPVTTPPVTTPPVTTPPATSGGSSSCGGGHDHNHNHSFALLSQSLAGGFHGHADFGQIATAASHASSWLNEALLSRPQH
jgi:hypothetical protein